MKIKQNTEQEKPQLAKNVSTTMVLLLGIGALLGGGIFTLIGPAIAFAGGAVLIALGINAVVSFLNLQTYVSFATTMPEAGGGNRWVKSGLGDFQGFIAGWISWLAHAAACGLYALSGGFYFSQFLILTFNVPLHSFLPAETFSKIFALLFIAVFGWLNWKSNKSTQQTGAFIVIALVIILGLFIVSGFVAGDALTPASWKIPFSDFWKYGFFGIMSAAALFYIAFEGSEIQAQSGEEVHDPKKLRIALFGAWGIVSAIYFLVALVMLLNGPLTEFGEGAIIKSAALFMPFGVVVMIVGGILANIAALNATIFSSSRLAFSLARDKSIFHGLSAIHVKNFTPHWTVLVSVVLISIMVIALPLISVGAAASLLFIILFLQLNIANIVIRKKNPHIKWNYRIIGYPITTAIAIGMYIVLAIAMAFVISAAWMVTIIWILLGMINYFAYTRPQRQEEFENEILYEKTSRLGPKKAYRVFLPIEESATSEEIMTLARFAAIISAHWQAELISATIVESNDKGVSHQKHMADKIPDTIADFNTEHKNAKIGTHTYVLSSKSIVDTILTTVREEDCDILILNWDGYVRSKRTTFGSKIDPVLRKAECDLIVAKDLAHIPGDKPHTILLATDYRFASPFLRFTGKVISAIAKEYKSTVHIFTVFPQGFTKTSKYKQWQEDLEFNIKSKIKLPADIPHIFKGIEHTSVASAILEESGKHDLTVMGGSRETLFGEIRIGNIPVFIAKHIKKPFLITKGHRGLTQPFIDYIKERIGLIEK
ncbi:MAG: amino acid permease [Candidatus Niyogibacteria bacterium]|nr:amino acid permease [Candidatus Niyogibacteria bacterium]